MRRLLIVPLLLALAGCGTATVAGPGPGDDSSAVASPEMGVRLPPLQRASSYSIDAPPEFHVVTAGGEQLDLKPWTACAGTGCYDGAPDDDALPDVGGAAAVTFGFDLPGWDFESVTFRELDVACPRRITVAAEKLGPRTFRIDPAGPAGLWAVDIFGRGREGGDAVTTIQWRTPSDGRLPVRARGSAAVLADHDGELDSYGVEVYLRDLDRVYSPASVAITVTGSTGRSVDLQARRGKSCLSAGDLMFRAGDDVGRSAIDVGPGPFTYTVRVELGATTYVGTGTWPDGETGDMAPHVPLTWDPPLPVYAG
ncbi:hypothetical protein [Nocardioides sp. LHG3406-4]|uniref:hypothetical protein n=1 Tax=Nocardioides sp. LHG3406-4 TaxID=2804575 RepID=UPI003CE90C3D